MDRKTKQQAKVIVIGPIEQGQKPIHFEKGGLHKALHVPQDQPIPESKKQAALEGKYGQRIKREAIFAFLGALAKGRETLRRRRRWHGVNRPMPRRPEPETLLYK